MRYALFVILLSILFIEARSQPEPHLMGGEMGYEFLRKDVGTVRYRLFLKVYRRCNDDFDFEKTATVKVLNTTNIRSTTGTVEFFSIELRNRIVAEIPLASKNYCAVNDPSGCIEMVTFTEDIDLIDSPNGYTFWWDKCCRNGRINIDATDTSCSGFELRPPEIVGGEGSTYSCKIPPPQVVASNNSPLVTDSVITGCTKRPLYYQFKFRDADGDSLSYKLATAFCMTKTATTDFYFVYYRQGYSPGKPMGGNPVITLDSTNGLLSGVPDKTGRFVVAFEVSEFRNGKLINVHRKEVQINVFDCDIKPPPDQINCKDRLIQFDHKNSGLNNSYAWDFGVQGINTDVSTDSFPTYLYQQNGDYKVSMIITNSLGCTDTAYAQIKVYAGLQPDFSFNGPICNGEDVRITDQTIFPVGRITDWTWTNVNTKKIFSTEKNPEFEYDVPNNQTYPFTIQLTVKTDRGCTGTIQKVIEIFPVPLAYAGPDTILAYNESYQMISKILPDYKYRWTPSLGLSDPNIANPILKHNKDQIYILEVNTSQRCLSYDTVSIKYYVGPEVYVPTAFSPNGDGRNDVFHFRPVSMTIDAFEIFDRWGGKIYSSTDYRKGWDGKVKGKVENAGMYIWYIKGKDSKGKPFSRFGTLVLVK